MNRLLISIICLVVIAALLGCCSENDRISATEEANKQLVRQTHEELMKGNFQFFYDNLADNYVRHCEAMPPGFQEITDKEVFVQFLKDYLVSVPDHADKIDLMIAEGDKVAYITTMTGTQSGPMGGLPPSNKSFSLVNIIIHRFENGKIAETWVSWDNVHMLTQLGFFPPPPPPEDNK